jgi:hypothetical protein
VPAVAPLTVQIFAVVAEIDQDNPEGTESSASDICG